MSPRWREMFCSSPFPAIIILVKASTSRGDVDFAPVDCWELGTGSTSRSPLLGSELAMVLRKGFAMLEGCWLCRSEGCFDGGGLGAGCGDSSTVETFAEFFRVFSSASLDMTS